jgi:hypothetical protein
VPILGDVPVAKIDRALVIRVLEPIWTTKTETASRVRGLSWPFWIGQRRANIGMATIRLAGKAPFPSCFRPVPK